MKTINWAPLKHCPSGQLQKANSTDAGHDIKIAKSVWIKPYSMLPFEWEDVGLKDELSEDIPDLFTPENYGVFFNPANYYPDLRTKLKYLVEFDPIGKMQVIAELNKLSRVIITEHTDTSFIVDTTSQQSEIEVIEGVTRIETVSVLQRKKFKPILVPTGIIVQPEELAWSALILRSGMTKYAIGMPHSVGIIDYTYDGELMIGLYPLEGHTVFRKGERIAQLVPIEQYEVETNELTLEQLKVHNRGGFGSTGGVGLKIA